MRNWFAYFTIWESNLKSLVKCCIYPMQQYVHTRPEPKSNCRNRYLTCSSIQIIIQTQINRMKMKQHVETIYSLSRIVIACILLIIPSKISHWAGWLILYFCLTLFIINNIQNKKILTIVLIIQISLSLFAYIALNSFRVPERTIVIEEHAIANDTTIIIR